jgi:succinoglycan biosynthesis protein ExoW
VVYRFAKVPQRRFPEAFFAGEDRAFLLQLVGEVGNVVFSTNVECVSGHGIHICYGSGWGSQRAVWRLCHDMLWRKWMQRTVPMNKAEAKENSRQIGNIRKAFVAAVLHEVRRRRGSINFDIIRFVLNDPLVLLYVLPLTLNIMFRKVRVRGSGC